MRLFKLAALVVSLMVVGIAFVLVPEASWSDSAIASIVLFALSIGYVFYTPFILTEEEGGNNASQLASLGALGTLSLVIMFFTVIAFVSSLFNMSKLAWAIDILAVGTFIFSSLILHAATNIIGNVEDEYSIRSKHIDWQGEVNNLKVMSCDPSSKSSLMQLAEKLRYSASDVPGGSPQDFSISRALLEINDLLTNDNTVDLKANILKLEGLIDKRNLSLHSIRNKT